MQTPFHSTSRAAGIFLRITLLSGLLAAFSLPALAQTPYVDAKGKPRISAVEAAVLTGGGATTLNTGWYLCSRLLNYTDTLTINGDVNLILGDGCDMHVTNYRGNCRAGILVSGADSLTVWAQSTNDAVIGSLTASGCDAGIGGQRGSVNGGTITIHGGIVNATSSAGAGIGGANGDKGGSGGTITIDGGTVNASSDCGGCSAGIGGGFWGAGGVIKIMGNANVTAKSQGGAGIGGGAGGAVGSIRITGNAKVTAEGAGAGIGAGMGGFVNGPTRRGGSIVIDGHSEVTASARGGSLGAGIYGVGGSIRIGGNAKVNAKGDNLGDGRTSGAGIGMDDGGSISITGRANVTASGGRGSAGIGGNGGTITITGKASVTANGGVGGAGIGGGEGSSEYGTGTRIFIATSGKVMAAGGLADPESSVGVGAGIGHGGYYVYGEDAADSKVMAGAGISPVPRPEGAAVAAGGDASFNVTVTPTGTPAPKIAYQWQQSTTDDKNWSDVTGATKAALNLPAVTASMNGNRYRCTVKVSGVGKKSSITYTTGSARLTVRQ